MGSGFEKVAFLMSDPKFDASVYLYPGIADNFMIIS